MVKPYAKAAGVRLPGCDRGPMLLGCIGDDLTGSSDLANTLAKGGMHVTPYNGVPSAPAAKEVEAGVVAPKSRTIVPADAVAQSLAALGWLPAMADLGYDECFGAEYKPGSGSFAWLDAMVGVRPSGSDTVARP